MVENNYKHVAQIAVNHVEIGQRLCRVHARNECGFWGRNEKSLDYAFPFSNGDFRVPFGSQLMCSCQRSSWQAVREAAHVTYALDVDFASQRKQLRVLENREVEQCMNVLGSSNMLRQAHAMDDA